MTRSEGGLSFLTRSETRIGIMRRLAAVGPCRRETLAESLGVSERTVKRTLDEFDSREWITETPSGCVLTALGEHVLEAYESATDRLAIGDKLEPLLKRVRADRSDIPIESFRDAEVVEATGNNPNATIERVLAFRESADRLRELSSLVTKESAGQLTQRVEEGDIDHVEVVLERDVVDTIEENPEYREPFERTVEADAVSMFVYEESFPFLIVLAEQQVALAVTDDAGLPAALVIADDPEAYEWAERTYDQFRDAATPLSGSRIPSGMTGSVESDSGYH